MKSLSKSLAIVSVVFVAFAWGCALIGYDLRGYMEADAGVEDAGKGGEGGAGPSTAGSGGSGPSSASASASTSSGGFCPSGCDDSDACTKDTCPGGACVHTPIPVDDGNACTTDGCDSNTGETHPNIPNCCPHSLCKSGSPIDSTYCNPQSFPTNCVTEVCGANFACCNTSWTENCVAIAKNLCVPSPGNPDLLITCMCDHSYCEAGKPLAANCDPCVYSICQKMPNCCMDAWDATCVQLTHDTCHVPLGPHCQ